MENDMSQNNKPHSNFYMICETSGALYAIPSTSVKFFDQPPTVTLSKIDRLFVDTGNTGRVFFTGDQLAHVFDVRIPIALAKTTCGKHMYAYAINVVDAPFFGGSGGGKILWTLSFAQSMALVDLKRDHVGLIDLKPILAEQDILPGPTIALFDGARKAHPAMRPNASQVLGAMPLRNLASLSSMERLLITILSTGGYVAADSKTSITSYFKSAQRQRHCKRQENVELTRIRSRVGVSPKLMSNVLRTAALSPSNWNWVDGSTETPPLKRYCIRRVDSSNHVIEPITTTITTAMPSSSASFGDLEDDVLSLVVGHVVTSILCDPSATTAQTAFKNVCGVSRQFKRLAIELTTREVQDGCKLLRDFVTNGTITFLDNILFLQQHTWRTFACSPLVLLSLPTSTTHTEFFKRKAQQKVSPRIVFARAGTYDPLVRDHLRIAVAS
ncbi:hypothetical protein N9S30_00190 [bacterium]|nr:hypothetical protein [bacterium]